MRALELEALRGRRGPVIGFSRAARNRSSLARTAGSATTAATSAVVRIESHLKQRDEACGWGRRVGGGGGLPLPYPHVGERGNTIHGTCP